MKKYMNRKTVKILSVALAVLLVTGGVIGVVYASAGSAEQRADNDASVLEKTIKDTIQINSDPDSHGKEETVYIIADAGGAVQDVIVSEWLKNPEGKETLADYTELSDIKNTKGDETFTAGDSNQLVWNAAGKDIHYQGTTQKKLPVAVSVTYLLDGQEIKPEELAGKSGHVTIRFNYENTQRVTAQIDGKNEEICVPFLMLSGVVMDNDTFANVKVSNGSVFNDGSRNIVVGCALPGMSESLDITDDDFEIPDYVEIEADTTDFSLTATLTVAMTGLFDNVDINTSGSIDDLKDSLNELKDAAQQLIDGSSALYDGTSELYSKCGDLENGVGGLLNGAKDLENGAGKVYTGASQMRDGLAELSKNSGALNGGARKIEDALFASATTQLRSELVSSGLMSSDQAASITLTSSNYVTVFQQLSGAVTVTPAQVEAQLRSKLSVMSPDQQSLTLTIAANLTAADSKLGVEAAVQQAAGIMSDAGTAQAACAVIDTAWLSDAVHQALIAQVKSATGVDDATAAKLSAVALALDSSNPAAQLTKAKEILEHAATAATTAPDAARINALCTAVASAATDTGNSKLNAVKSQLDEMMSFFNGLSGYTHGVDTVYGYSKQLADGASELKGGTKKLYAGVYELYGGSKKLVSGVAQLKDGSLELSEGMNKFYDEGIEKLVDALDGDYTKLIDRLRAVADAGKAYHSFAGIPEGMAGSVKFIYRTDSVTNE